MAQKRVELNREYNYKESRLPLETAMRVMAYIFYKLKMKSDNMNFTFINTI